MVVFSIAKNEIKRLVRDKVVLALGLVMLTLLVASVFTGTHYYQQTSKQHNEAREIARLQWVNQGDKNPHSAAHYGTFAFKPVSALSVFDPGVDRYTGVSLFLEAHKQNFASYSLAEDKDASMRFAELTPSFIFAFLFPLFIILAGYRMITSEKESGMYRFLMSQGISHKQFVLGKVFGLWGITLFLFLPFLLVGLVMLLYTSPGNTDIIRFMMMSLIWLLYFGVVVHITIGVSAISKSSGTSMVLLLSLWILSTLLVPRLVTNMASAFYPVPNTTELYQIIRTDLLEGIDGHNPYSEHSAAFRDSVLHVHGVEEVSDLPFNFQGLMLQEAEEFEKKIYDYHLTKIDEIHQKQIRMFAVSSIFSPTIASRLASMSAAGTDIYSYKHFFDAAEEYRISLMRELNMDLKNNDIGGRNVAYTVNAEFYSQNASFSYEKPANILLTSEQRIPLVLTTFWFLASIIFVQFFAMRKESK